MTETWVFLTFVAASLIAASMLCSALLAPGHEERNFRLQDGRIVHCLILSTAFAKAPSCDWQHARRPPG